MAPSYRVPEDNPFVGQAGVLPEIWAWGLRNPQRFSWDSGGSGRMFIVDIGQANVEEVNLGRAGANYGWSLREGRFVVVHQDEDQKRPLPADDAELGISYPVAQYGHEDGFAIAGGFVYRGQEIPELKGKYVFGAIAKGRLFYFDAEDLEPGDQVRIHELLISPGGRRQSLLEVLGDDYRADLRFGMDGSGELYVLTKRDGAVRRMRAASR